MQKILSPYKFVPLLKSVIWGGSRIAPFKGIETDVTSIGESWEISGVPGHETEVAEGPDAGLKTSELVARHKDLLVGKKVYETYGTRFPLLVKFIDASKDLSVQVHPNDEIAARHHQCPGKNEMWYIIDSDTDSTIYCGLKKPLSPEELEQHIEESTIMQTVEGHHANTGDIFYVPSGRIHCIGAGNFLAEIQQSSDITYRVYDFDRVGKDGRKRELHVDLAKEALEYGVADDAKLPTPAYEKGLNALVNCNTFLTNCLVLDGKFKIDMPDAFLVMMCVEGSATIHTEGGDATMKCGETVLIPAMLRDVTAEGRGRILTATLPTQ